MRCLLVIAALLTATGCVATQSEERKVGRIKVKLLGARKRQDKITVVREDGRRIVDVRSRSGIGIAELAVSGGTWPKPFIVRLHLRGMEMFSVSNGQMRLSVAIPTSAPDRTVAELADLERKTVTQIKRSSAYWVPVRVVDADGNEGRKIPVRDGYLELLIPEVIHDYGADRLTIQWIDFYR